VAPARGLPNAVALAATPVAAAWPEVRQVPLPASAYVKPLEFTPTKVQAVYLMASRSPLGRMQICVTDPTLADVAATPRYAPLPDPVPRYVEMTPVVSDTRRTRAPVSSDAYNQTPSVATPCTRARAATAACPPSPVDAVAPVPATVRTLQKLAGVEVRDGERVAVSEDDEVVVAVILRVVVGEGSPASQPASHRTARTR